MLEQIGSEIIRLETLLHKITREISGIARAVSASRDKREKMQFQKMFSQKMGEKASIIRRIEILTKNKKF